MLHVDVTDVEKLHKALKGMREQSLPWAAQNAFNTSAFAARREWAKEGRRSMIVRQPKSPANAASGWTFGGRHHQVVKARLKKNINQMEAVAGNRLKYVAQQERGFTRFAMSRKGVPWPRRLGRLGSDVKRLVRKPFWRRNMRVSSRLNYMGSGFDRTTRRGPRGQSPLKRYIAASIQQAKSEGKHLVYLEFPDGKKGIYDVKTKTKVKLIWDLSKRMRRTKANPMLRKTLKRLEPVLPIYHKSALEFEIHRVLKKRGLRPGQSTAIITRILR